MTEQRLAKHAALHEIEILIADDTVGCRHAIDLRHDGCGKPARLHIVIVRLGKKLQTEAGGVGGKLMEIDRMIDCAQLVVAENPGWALHNGIYLRLEKGRGFFSGLAGVEPSHDVGGAMDPGLEIGNSAQMKRRKVQKSLADAAAGEGVVADKGD